MSLSRFSRRLPLVVCLACQGLAASAAPIFLSDLPDFYQHQLSGADASAPFGRPGRFAGYSDPLVPTYDVAMPVDDGGPGVQWERNGGWCAITAMTDVFYRLDRQGVTGLFDHGGNRSWLERMNYAISDLAIKRWGLAEDAPMSTASFIDAKVGANRVRIDWLTWDANLGQVLSNGSPTPYVSMYSAYAGQLALGHSAVLNLVDPGKSNPDWWWAKSYHMVAAAGYDDSTSAIFYADPNGRGSDPESMNWGHPYGPDDPLPVGFSYYQSSIMGQTGLLSGDDVFSGALVTDIFVLSIVPEIDPAGMGSVLALLGGSLGPGFGEGVMLAGGGIPQVVYGRALSPSTRLSAHGRCILRISRAAQPPAACRPGTTPPLRASPPREDSPPQDHLREPRELARVA